VKQKSQPFAGIVIPALDRSVLKRQLDLSAGFAKIAPYLPCHRDSFSAKVPGLVAGWLRQVTLTAHTRWPLAFSIQLLRTETTTSAFRLELAAKQQHSGIHR